jgi:hypothetical protein
MQKQISAKGVLDVQTLRIRLLRPRVLLQHLRRVKRIGKVSRIEVPLPMAKVQKQTPQPRINPKGSGRTQIRVQWRMINPETRNSGQIVTAPRSQRKRTRTCHKPRSAQLISTLPKLLVESRARQLKRSGRHYRQAVLNEF